MKILYLFYGLFSIFGMISCEEAFTSIKEIDISVLLVEKEGFVKLSFRSKGDFSVSDFAKKYFGGGGHKNAAGGEYFDSLGNTINYFLESLKTESEKIINPKK